MKKVYIVKSNHNIEGVYTTREKAEAVRKEAEWCAGMAGRNDLYYVEEYEVEE